MFARRFAKAQAECMISSAYAVVGVRLHSRYMGRAGVRITGGYYRQMFEFAAPPSRSRMHTEVLSIAVLTGVCADDKNHFQ